MNNQKKLLLPIFLLLTIYAIYILTSAKEIGSFDKIRSGGEINHNINVLVVGSKGFERDRSSNIISFYARDKNGAEAKVTLREPAPEEIINAEVVKLFGHMHNDNFIALRVSIIKSVE
jgi:hypothetical protein